MKDGGRQEMRIPEGKRRGSGAAGRNKQIPLTLPSLPPSPLPACSSSVISRKRGRESLREVLGD